jgi:hypothetical protein
MPSDPLLAQNPARAAQGEQPALTTPPVEEALVAEWQEAEREAVRGTVPPSAIVIGGSILGVVLVGLGIWQHEFNFYLAAIVIFLAVTTVIVQMRRQGVPLPITLTTYRLIVGKRQYAIADLAGFWLGRDGGNVEINVETKKPGMVPISFLYSTSIESEARATLGQVMPELEPRLPTATDSIARYFRL